MLAVRIDSLGVEPSPTDEATVDALIAEVRDDPSGVSILEVSDWALAIHPGWLAVVERADDPDVAPRYRQLSGSEEARSVLRLMGLGGIDDVLVGDWRSTPGSP